MIPIELRSVGNIRDLGGTGMKNGSVIRRGCLIRSAHLGYAAQADIQLLRDEHRLSKIIDLRTGGERSELPDHSFGIEHLRLPIFNEFKAGISHETQQKQSDIPRMEDLYRFIMTDTDSVAGFRNVLKAIFTHDYRKGSVLWHCTEGKDRCGMTTALVLTALGADRDTILEDYLETNISVICLASRRRSYRNSAPRSLNNKTEQKSNLRRFTDVQGHIFCLLLYASPVNRCQRQPE